MPSTLTFITESLPDFTQNTPANFQIEAVGGTPPYTFEITQGALPPAMSLSQTGLITGTPALPADTTVFVKLSDAAGDDLTQAFAVRVAPAEEESGGGNGGNGGNKGCLNIFRPRPRPRA